VSLVGLGRQLAMTGGGRRRDPDSSHAPIAMVQCAQTAGDIGSRGGPISWAVCDRAGLPARRGCRRLLSRDPACFGERLRSTRRTGDVEGTELPTLDCERLPVRNDRVQLQLVRRAGSAPGITPRGLPQIRTCAINAYGSSSHGLAYRTAH
jgi:hypothetical protein